jgi:hypothetical protein
MTKKASTARRRESHDTEPLRAELVSFFKEADQWQARVSQPTPTPEDGSSLAGDDQALGTFSMSHAVVTSLSSAVDNYHALRGLLLNVREIHTSASFTLLRVALENSATAIYLLSPSNRQARIVRRLKLQWADYQDAENARKLMKKDDDAEQERRKTNLRDTARAVGVPEDTLAGLLGRPPGFGTIVAEAGTATFGPYGDIASLSWMVNSGIVHARTWASLSLFEKEMFESARPGYTNVRMSSSQSTIMQHAQIAAAMIGHGWMLFDQRRVCHHR